MKILISNAIWGETYCSIFARFSLATLLSHNNIPALAKRATITWHIVTLRADYDRLLREPAIAELQRYCQIEWELLEDYGISAPPTGPGGEKYPFLSALQNLSIKRSVDHDVVVFNYADFIWADGSLSNVIQMLAEGRAPLDAVFGFCLPVDRDLAVLALEWHRRIANPEVLELAPRDGARIAFDCIHREAKIRFWDETPRFTNLPSYLIWRVGEHGLVIRSYHQSILAMRTRPNDPNYVRGILRGGLDSSFAGQLATSKQLGFATDSDHILVYSLYDTIVDSRVPEGVTREMSFQSVLAGDVTPQQRHFAERPFFMRLRDGGEEQWRKVAEKSWDVLRRMQDATAFDQAIYDERLATHGVVPKIARLNAFERYVFPIIQPTRDRLVACATASRAAAVRTAGIARHAFSVLRQPPRLRAAVRRRIERWLPGGRTIARIVALMLSPSRFPGAIRRRLKMRSRQPLGEMFGMNTNIAVAPGVWVDPAVCEKFGQALVTEQATSNREYNMSALRNAEEMLRLVVDTVPVWIEPARALGRNLWFQSRFDEAIQAFAEAEQLRNVGAWIAGLPVDSHVFLPRNCAESIGLMGHIDAFVKYKILTGDPRSYYLLAPPQNVVNAAFLDYWKEHITIVSHRGEIARLKPKETIYGVNWNWVMPKGTGTVFVHEGIAAVTREWQRSGRPPLLQLRGDHEDELTRTCARWGMAPGDRFVCLHVRAFGFYRDAHDKAQEFRNTPIESYYPLVRELSDRGLWVIRMGDASMPPLDIAECGDSGRVIDYAHSADKSAAMDVALCARCELFVSSPSGLHTVAHAFGRPVCELNYPIYAGFPWCLEEIFIPQLYFSRDKGRVLTLREILGSDMIHHDHQFLLEGAGISLIPNDPDDIVETVREALSPSTYQVKDSALADRVCGVFEELNRQYDRGISGRLGRYFAVKYAAQLLPTD